MTWQEAATGIAGVALFGAIVVVVIIQLGGAWRARMSVAREEAYSRLAEEATHAQQQTAQQLERVVAELTDVRQRTSELERILKEVEEPWSR